MIASEWMPKVKEDADKKSVREFLRDRRILKYRAWDGKRMDYDWKDWVSLKNVDPMQYIGLCDKNGNEIYECDVLTNKFNCWGIVQYEGDGFMAVMNYSDGSKAPIKLSAFSTALEICGNIFENIEYLLL